VPAPGATIGGNHVASYRRMMLCQIAAVIFAVALVRPDASMAQARYQPPKYDVIGFRDARFGMTEWDVRATARESFGAKDDDMTVNVNPIDGTTKLIVHVPMLEPAWRGPGRILLRLPLAKPHPGECGVGPGYQSAPQQQRDDRRAARLQRHFLGFAWANKSVRAGVPIDESSVLLFSGEDAKGGAYRSSSRACAMISARTESCDFSRSACRRRRWWSATCRPAGARREEPRPQRFLTSGAVSSQADVASPHVGAQPLVGWTEAAIGPISDAERPFRDRAPQIHRRYAIAPRSADYLADRSLATVLFLALRMDGRSFSKARPVSARPRSPRCCLRRLAAG